ncbi:hypothetical protein [Arthrobacter caoxuetaonis]|uniref:Uncharacterized protein n=1 Tax=Arthrobacter caoxuetaonis TaxID=2886935 RepID=A0A9X1SGD4_9MICC|nr:hypothetical protein [Arthrobacter caoxuetaonis]MCC3299264.1 hypothetical protein [Arthrobacter caoxuetaonis]USQ59242.1 hypothetical protein NF551_16800 [Arthrobacter caoxuetaonis]
MALTPSQRRNRRLAAGAALAAAAVAAGALGLWVTGGKTVEASASSIPALVPADADTLVIAPFSGSWWEKVAPMDEPNKMLPELDPASAGLDIENIGYSRSVDPEDHGVPFALPLRLFYIESPTGEGAEEVAEWLKDQPAADNRSVAVEGDVVVIGSSTTTYKAPEESVLELEAYDPERREGEATMWMNTGREAVSLTGDGNNDKALAFTEVLSSGFGFEEGTKWLGTSTDGESWSGAFTAGGVNPDAIDFKKAVTVLASTEEVLASVEGPTGTAEVVKPGLGAILETASFIAGTKHMGAFLDEQGSAGLDDPFITVTSDVTAWNAAISGVHMANENLSERTLAANAEEMVVTYSYGK